MSPKKTVRSRGNGKKNSGERGRSSALASRLVYLCLSNFELPGIPRTQPAGVRRPADVPPCLRRAKDRGRRKYKDPPVCATPVPRSLIAAASRKRHNVPRLSASRRMPGSGGFFFRERIAGRGHRTEVNCARRWAHISSSFSAEPRLSFWFRVRRGRSSKHQVFKIPTT